MKRLALPLLFVVAVAAGCKPASVAGTYRAGPGVLALAEEGTFTLSQEGGLGDMKGTWKLTDDKLTLEPKTIGGQPLDDVLNAQAKLMHAKPETVAKMKDQIMHFSGTVSGDRSTIVLTAGKGGSLTFSRAHS